MVAGTSAFPTSLDTDAELYAAVDGETTILAAHHNVLKNAIKNAQVKVGIDSSAVKASLDYRTGKLAPDYIVFIDGSNFRARNCSTGLIEFDSTDAKTTIQAAIGALPAGGGLVLLRAGTYEMSDALSLADKECLFGAGKGATILNFTSTTSDGIDLSGVLFGAIGKFTIATTRINQAGNAINTDMSYGVIRDIAITGKWSVGILLDAAIGNALYNIDVKEPGGVPGEEAQVGYKFTNTSNANELRKCNARDCDYGIHLVSGDRNMIWGGDWGYTVKRAGSVGIKIGAASHRTLIVGSWIEDVETPIVVDAGSYDTCVLHPWCPNNTTTFVSDSGTGTVIFRLDVLGTGGSPWQKFGRQAIKNETSDPSTAGWGAAEKGRMWFNSTTNVIKYWDGSAIKTVTGS